MADGGRLAPQETTDTSVRKAEALVVKRLERAAKAARPFEPVWDEALAFYDNDQWVERSAVNGELQHVETREGDPFAKPRWRSRLTRNRYTPAIEAEKAAIAARVPVPECFAPSGNQEAINAALLSEKVCLSLYRKLRIKQLVLDAANYAFNCGAGYAWPFWNSNVGQFLQDPETGELVRTGEIEIWLLGPKAVGWEPGVKFENSRWYYVRKAQPVEEVKAREGYTGPADLKADTAADRRERGQDTTTTDLVYVYHYLERPSKKHPAGRWMQIAGGYEIAQRADYPCTEDVPVLHELADIRRDHRERPMGRGELMLDVQRTYNRTVNQIIAWKNLVLNPQLMAPKGAIRTPVTDQPGVVVEYRPIGGQAPFWREVPAIPESLFRTLDQCILDWQEITGQHQLPVGIESGSGVVAINERDQSRRAVFIENLATFYSGLFSHLLYLVQRHYTEPRLLEVKTRFGTESIQDFVGAKLMPGITVHVNPGSIEPRTRAAQEAKIIMYAERGWLPPHQVMAALNAGNADQIIDDFELDVAKAAREIQQLIAMGRGEGYGPVFAAPTDNHQVHKDVLGAWMKTEDFERQDEEVKMAAMWHWEQHSVELMLEQMQAAGEQLQAAQDKGMQGAAEGGTGDTNLTSLPGLEGTVRGLQGAPAPS